MLIIPRQTCKVVSKLQNKRKANRAAAASSGLLLWERAIEQRRGLLAGEVAVTQLIQQQKSLLQPVSRVEP